MCHLSYPVIQELHLRFGVEPMFTSVHDGQRRMMRFCETTDYLKWY